MPFKFHGVAPKIPIQKNFTGDKVTGLSFVPIGEKLIYDLKRDMSFRGLKIGEKTIKSETGIIVNATINHGLSIINVHVPIPVKDEEEVQVPFMCACGEFFSEGVVVGVTTVEGYVTPAQLYTVDVCQEGNTSITVKNCVAHDFSVFGVGERVWCCLSVREVIATVPNCRVDPNLYSFAFSMPWGAMGTEQGFSWVYDGVCADATEEGCYNGGYLAIDAGAKGPCTYDIDVPIIDWPGVYPQMCTLFPDISDCAYSSDACCAKYWMYQNFNNTKYEDVQKNSASLYGEYTMLLALGETPVLPDNPEYLFNLQIMKI